MEKNGMICIRLNDRIPIDDIKKFAANSGEQN